MASVAWNDVRVKLLTALPGVVGAGTKVYNGPVATGENPPAYLTIGHQPSKPDNGGGAFEQQNGPDGFAAIETGQVLAELSATSGNAEVPDVWATFALIAAWVQADMTLGGTLYAGSTCTVGAEVIVSQTSSGAVQRLLLSFNYFARL